MQREKCSRGPKKSAARKCDRFFKPELPGAFPQRSTINHHPLNTKQGRERTWSPQSPLRPLSIFFSANSASCAFLSPSLFPWIAVKALETARSIAGERRKAKPGIVCALEKSVENFHPLPCGNLDLHRSADSGEIENLCNQLF